MERVAWCNRMWICRRVGTGAHSAPHGLNASAMDWSLTCTGKGLFFQVGIDTQHAFGWDFLEDSSISEQAPRRQRLYMRTIGSVDLLTLLSFLYGDTRCDYLSIRFVNRLRQYWLIQHLRQIGMHTIGHCFVVYDYSQRTISCPGISRRSTKTILPRVPPNSLSINVTSTTCSPWLHACSAIAHAYVGGPLFSFLPPFRPAQNLGSVRLRGFLAAPISGLETFPFLTPFSFRSGSIPTPPLTVGRI